jgi:PAS domain S-box-containing protein
MQRQTKVGAHTKKKQRRRAAAPKRGPRPKTAGARPKSSDAGASSPTQESQATLDLIPALAWRARADGFTEYLNGRWLDYTGASLEEALGWEWLALIHADDVPALRNIWLKALESGQPGEAEARMKRRDGVYRWFLIRAVPARDDTGAVVAWYGINTDIEELKAAEFARQSKAMSVDAARLQETLDSIPTLAWRARADGFREYLNQRWLDYTGFTLQQASGWQWMNAVHPDDQDRIAAVWQALLTAPKTNETEARLRRFDGTYRWFLFRAQPVYEGTEVLVGWQGTNDDIEDRKRAETELRINEQRYRELFNYTPVGLLEIDARKRTEMLDDLHRQGVTDIEAYLNANPDFEQRAIDASIIKDVNPQTVEMLGAREAKDLIGLSTARLLSMSAGGLRAGTVSRFRGDKLFQHEIKVKTLDGRAIDIVLTVARPDVSRNFLALTDITKRKAAEDALRDSERRYHDVQMELAHVNRMATIGHLSASIAHEVNQPLSGIVTNASTCVRMMAADPPNIAGALETARRAIRDANRAADIITRLRTLFAKKKPSDELVNLNDASNEIISLSHRESQGGGVVVQSEFTNDLPPVKGDRIQLQQVLLNLIQNGLDAMSAVDSRPKQLIITTAKVEPDNVSVAVQDTGPGVDPENLERIFEAFYTTKSNGLGMGLSICRAIIEAHGGKLWATAAAPQGTILQFTLPAAEV